MPVSPSSLAVSVLLVHLAVVAFNIFGLVAVPVGEFFGWRFVRGFWWRLAHLVSLALVALQAALGRACFLTIWEGDLTAETAGGSPEPMIATWVNSLLYWPLPIWVFAVVYVAVLLYALLLWRWVPPRRAGTPSI